ncbi:MAG TPA: PorP/SprF family type IX secretion system membrane protein [Flavobacterium sp.]|jgi:type IX secretion system PorP/SprF family membrane protein
MLKNYVLCLFILAVSLVFSQENAIGSFDIPVNNALKFNKFLINPTFSFVREDYSQINIFNRRQWVKFENAPQLYLLNYTGQINQSSRFGVGLYQQTLGLLTNFGAHVNYAYNVALSDENNFAFGLNIYYYNSGFDTGKIIATDPEPLQDLKSNLVAVKPGLNFGTAFLDFGLAVNNLFLYNLQTSTVVKDDVGNSYVGHIMYTGFFEDAQGILEESKFTGLVQAEKKKEDTGYSGNLLFDAPKIGWAQAGYNKFYGFSAGVGFNVTKRISVGYTYEQGIGDISKLGASHEITLAFIFKKYDDEEYADQLTYKPVKQPAKKAEDLADKNKNETDAKTEKERLALEAVNRLEQANEAKLERQKLAQETVKLKNAERQKAQEAVKAERERLALESAAKKQSIDSKPITGKPSLALEEANKKKADAKAALEKQRLDAAALAQQNADKQHLALEEANKKKADAKAALEKQHPDAAALAQQNADKQRLALEEANKKKTDAKAALEKQRLDAAALAQQNADKQRLALEEANKKKADAKAALEKERLDAAALAQQNADKQRLVIEEANKKKEAEAKAALEKEQLVVENIKKLKENDVKAKALDNYKSEIDSKAKVYDKLIVSLDSIVKARDLDLKQFKEEGDVNTDGTQKPSQKVFVSTAEANLQLAGLKKNLADNKAKFDKLIIDFETKNNERLSELKAKGINDSVTKQINEYYLKNLNDLKLKREKFIKLEKIAEQRIEEIKAEKEIERQRRIKKAEFDSEKERIAKAQKSLDDLLKNKNPNPAQPAVVNDKTTSPAKSDPFSSDIPIIKNITDTDSGYYLVLDTFSTIEERDAFLAQVINSGETNVKSFFNVYNSKYYVYIEKYDDISKAAEANKKKGSTRYNTKMFVVKVEKR